MRAYVLFLAVLLILPACNTPMPWQKQQAGAAPADSYNPLLAGPESAPGLPSSSDSRFKDVPMPVGLTEIAERSFVFQSDSLEIGRMTYSTRASVEELVEFYYRECKNKGWALGRVIEAEAKMYEFTMPGKKLLVSVQNKGMAKGRIVIITYTPDSGAISAL